ncbi:MAG TPA: FAD-dependent oxidoreductase [Stellaceae bacterium]|nr:FAD-dependent oxidoreductase [Stellaceae bacterium]
MTVEVAIVGAGPYGLSIAAHLAATDVPFQIFGRAMRMWTHHMPAGMCLKSEGFASSLWDPEATFTLAHYCTANGIPYADIGAPVSLRTFSDYGLAFQRRFVPGLDQRSVAKIDRGRDEFRVILEDGEVVTAKRVVVAAGLSHYAHIPDELRALPQAQVSHSSHHRDLGGLGTEDVVVIGAGASALDCASLLSEQGAAVQLVTRRESIRFHNPPGDGRRAFLERLRAPMSGLGPGWRSRFCTDAPLVFHRLPERVRLAIVKRHLGPAPGWWTRKSVEGKLPMHFGLRLHGAKVRDARVQLDLRDPSGGRRILEADHVISASGFVVDLRRLPFLAPDVLDLIRTVEHTPVLSSHLESSLPGLYFVGVSSANSFGPMMRFAFGAGYTARRLSRHLSSLRRQVADLRRSGSSDGRSLGASIEA